MTAYRRVYDSRHTSRDACLYVALVWPVCHWTQYHIILCLGAKTWHLRHLPMCRELCQGGKFLPIYPSLPRGKSGPALGGTKYRLMPSACWLIVRAKFTISIHRESCTNAKAKYSSSVVPPDPSVHFYHCRSPLPPFHPLQSFPNFQN